MSAFRKNPILRFLSSYGLSVILLLLLLLLTYLGTMDQVGNGIFKIQKKYFESAFLVSDVLNGIPLPLPGAYLVMVVLFINLLLGGVLRVKWSVAGAGLITTHLGIMLLLIASFVSHASAIHGSVTLYEGDETAEFRSSFLWEIAIYPALEKPTGQPVREYLIPHREFMGLADGQERVFGGKDLPLDLRVTGVIENSWPKGEGRNPPTNPVVDRVYLEDRRSEKETEQNIPGVYLYVKAGDGGEEQRAILWGESQLPLLVKTPKGRWAVELRKKRSNLPFGLRLDKFTHEYYPGTRMPRVFLSDVTKIADGSERKVKIEMNQPLRSEGFTVYQSNWGPQGAREGTRLFSGFSVVTNPSDQWPLIACIVIGLGLFIHFTRVLLRYLRRETGGQS